MDELISRFAEVRDDFIETLQRFPTVKRDVVLFGEWSLKDVIAHFVGWDRYFIDLLDSLQVDEEPPYWQNMTKFNKASVDKRRESSWEAVYEAFVSTSEEFIRRYRLLPEALREIRFWRNKSYSPISILEINIHHYEKSHLAQIKKTLSGIEKV
jgi:hypothetical protein